MKIAVAIAGWATTRTNLLCRIVVSHSRGPRSPLRAAGLSARSARVTGAPSTRKIGTSMDSVMCSAMCALNSTLA